MAEGAFEPGALLVDIDVRLDVLPLLPRPVFHNARLVVSLIQKTIDGGLHDVLGLGAREEQAVSTFEAAAARHRHGVQQSTRCWCKYAVTYEHHCQGGCPGVQLSPLPREQPRLNAVHLSSQGPEKISWNISVLSLSQMRIAENPATAP
jgi:hypothetical protein